MTTTNVEELEKKVFAEWAKWTFFLGGGVGCKKIFNTRRTKVSIDSFGKPNVKFVCKLIDLTSYLKEALLYIS